MFGVSVVVECSVSVDGAGGRWVFCWCSVLVVQRRLSQDAAVGILNQDAADGNLNQWMSSDGDVA